MNLPNKITIARVFMIPLFLIVYLTNVLPYNNIIAVSIFIIASLTDALDGYLARKNNLVTNFGKFADPLADKLLVSAALICFVELHLVPSWVIILIISREFIISGFRLVAADKGVVIAASKIAKVKTTAQMIMSILLIIHLNNPVFYVLEQVSIYAAVILTVLSLVDYLYKNMDVLKDANGRIG